MKLLDHFTVCVALIALTVMVNPVQAADSAGMGAIAILAPTSDAVLQSGAENKLEFNVKLSPRGNHLHIYIDNQDSIIERNVAHCPCSVALPKLTPGKHVIVIKEATSGHAMTGVERSVTVTVK